MVEFLTFLSKYLSGTALYIVAAVIGCVLTAPQVVKMWDSWKDFRSGKGELAVKKMQLEVLKLRYEVEMMKEKLSRPLDPETKSITVPAAIEPSLAPQAAPARAIGHPKQWAWLRGLAFYNRTGAILLLNLLRVIAWIVLVSFGGFLAFSLYYMVAPPPGLTSSGSASTLILLLPGTLASYLTVHRLKIQFRLLSGPPELKHEPAGLDRDKKPS